MYETSKKYNADYTGGIIKTIPWNKSFSASLVQALTTHKFGVGNSGFRTSVKFNGESDTASFGLFKKDVFEKHGLFNEKLIRCQDYELNRRIKKNGGKIWMNSDAIVNYKNKKSLSSFLRKQFFYEAPYNAYMWYIAPYTFSFRHSITLFFSVGILGGAILSQFISFLAYIYFSVILLYFILAEFSSIQQAMRYKKLSHVIFLPICFFLYHFFHGLGTLVGFINLIFHRSPVQKA